MNLIILSAILIYIAKLSISSFNKGYPFCQKLYLVLLFVVHFGMMAFSYCHVQTLEISDAKHFYLKALYGDSWFSFLGFGSDFFIFLIYPLVKANISFFTLFVLFSAISYHGFLFYFNDFAKSEIKEGGVFNISILQWLFLLPTFHYWSSLLGKDSLLFFLITLLLYRTKENKLYTLATLPILFLIAAIRPHVFSIVVVAVGSVILVSKQYSKKTKIRILVSSFLLMAITVPLFFRFLRVKNFSLQAATELTQKINTIAITSGSGINYQESNFFERMWLLLFRPFFYDARTKYEFVISIENAVVLVSFLVVLLIFVKNRKNKLFVWTDEMRFSLLLGLGTFLMISTYIYNLGLASRMRLIFMPLFFYILYKWLPQIKSDRRVDSKETSCDV